MSPSAIPPEQAEALLRSAGLMPLQPYPGSRTPWLALCMRCGHRTSPTLSSLRRGSGCKFCAKVVVDPAELAEIMRTAGLTPLVPYPGSRVPWLSKCNCCGRQVSPTLGSIRAGHRCTFCSGRRVDPAEAVAVMRAAGLEPLDDFPGSMSPWRARCTRCDAETSPRYGNVRARGGGCRFCAGRGS